MVTLAKSLGGGLPSGAIGMTAGARRAGRGRARAPGGHLQRQSALDGRRAREPRQVLTPAAYDELERLGDRMAAGCERVIEARGESAPRRRVGTRLEGLRAVGGPTPSSPS